MDGPTRLLSYDELGALLGFTPGSVRNLVRKRRWGRHPGNDGRQRVAVPVAYLEAHSLRDGESGGESAIPTGGASAGESGRAIGVAAIAALTAHIERLEKDLAGVKDELAAERLVAAQVGALKEALEATRDERDRVYTLLHVRESRQWWRRLLG